MYNAVCPIDEEVRRAVRDKAKLECVSIVKMHQMIYKEGLKALGLDTTISGCVDLSEFDVVEDAKSEPISNQIKHDILIKRTGYAYIMYIPKPLLTKTCLNEHCYLMFNAKEKLVMFVNPLISNKSIEFPNSKTVRYTVQKINCELSNMQISRSKVVKLMDIMFGCCDIGDLLRFELRFSNKYGCYYISNQ